MRRLIIENFVYDISLCWEKELPVKYRMIISKEGMNSKFEFYSTADFISLVSRRKHSSRRVVIDMDGNIFWDQIIEEISVVEEEKKECLF